MFQPWTVDAEQVCLVGDTNIYGPCIVCYGQTLKTWVLILLLISTTKWMLPQDWMLGMVQIPCETSLTPSLPGSSVCRCFLTSTEHLPTIQSQSPSGKDSSSFLYTQPWSLEWRHPWRDSSGPSFFKEGAVECLAVEKNIILLTFPWSWLFLCVTDLLQRPIPHL